MTAFTIDIDWATELVIEHTLLIFEEYRVKCTLFATHHSEALDNCNRELFEIAIHPNFNPLMQGKSNVSVESIIGELIKLYPESKGIRCHGMTQSSYLLDQFFKLGFVYDANHFLPYWDNIKPYKLWNGLVKIPYNWEDDIHFMYGK